MCNAMFEKKYGKVSESVRKLQCFIHCVGISLNFHLELQIITNLLYQITTIKSLSICHVAKITYNEKTGMN